MESTNSCSPSLREAIEESHSKAATPSAMTLVSSDDGLTHTITIICAEAEAIYEIHDAVHTVVAASVKTGEKIRGLTPGASYHCHAIVG